MLKRHPGPLALVVGICVLVTGYVTSPAQVTTTQTTATTGTTTTSTAATSTTTTAPVPPTDPSETAERPAPEEGYLRFLEENSMLYQADLQDDTISGMGIQWREDFGQPEPDELKNRASVWLLYYPGSVITSPGDSVIGTWANPDFWAANGEIGISLLHTNPTQSAGGLRERDFTQTIDGWFDRIGLDTAPELGTEEDYEELVTNAGEQGATIAGDLVPLHSGVGPDFRLAEYGFEDYPGLYNMVEIRPEDWGLLPAVDDAWGAEHVSREAAAQLKQRGYIPGFIESADADPEANTWSGWSATPRVVGVDGQTRRWVYLHVFKPEQPAYNWLDPTYAARRLQFGDAARNIVERGVPVLRLDANTFLGLEPQPGNDQASHYLTSLANVSTTDVAFMARKLGGFTYQEFAAPLQQLKAFAPNGADLSYDFFTRAEGLYALIDGDGLPLRLGHHFLLEAEIPAGNLIHDLQNHDEITFQMFELGAHGDFEFEGQSLNGQQLKQQVLEMMRSTVGAAPYNRLYRPEEDGVATTYAGFIAPALGIEDPYNATPEEVALIQRGHLLVAHANAMIPGVFALAAWDLVGALPVAVEDIPSELTEGGDWRWINRGGVDLVDANPEATHSEFGMPKAQTLYGPLPQQLEDPNSFASQVSVMLTAREEHRIHQGRILAVPNVGNRSVVVLVMQLPDDGGLAVTALNYGREATSVDVELSAVPEVPPESAAGQTALDIISGEEAGVVSDDGVLTIDLEELAGRTLVLQDQ